MPTNQISTKTGPLLSGHIISATMIGWVSWAAHKNCLINRLKIYDPGLR